jgi:N-acetylmuramoyl-L-alanine amidase
MSIFKKVSIILITLSLFAAMAYPAYASSYTVKPGDSLYTVGKLFSCDAVKIMDTNNLSSNIIYPGQVLNVPAVTYTVKSGDTLYLIAKRYGVTVLSIRSASNQWNNTIKPGQVLVIPSVSSNSNISSGSSTSRGLISYTPADLDLLARLITAEAGGEPYNAKVAVGAVVVNRVRDPRFPKTIHNVVYAIDNGYYQFTPVENGWINKPASKDAISAAYDALHNIDPTKGAVFYFDDSATNTWLWSKPIAIRIDNMVFTY